MFTFGNLARHHTYRPRFSHFSPYRAHRADGISPSKKAAMMDAAIYKGAAVATAGLVGGISAYKGLPEIKNFAGLDVLGGLALAGAEFWMLWKGQSGKAVAAVGGVSTGLLCHWAAVQGTIWGATKAKAEGGTPQSSVQGWDYDAVASTRGLEASHSVPAHHQAPAAAQRNFEPYYGMM